jgi:hypothetical protein
MLILAIKSGKLDLTSLYFMCAKLNSLKILAKNPRDAAFGPRNA